MTFIINAITNNFPLDGEMSTTVMADDHGIAVTALRVNVSSFQGVSFYVNTTTDGYMNGINTYPFASNFSEATFISLPETLFTELRTNVTETHLTISVFVNDSLFMSRSSEDTPSSIASPVISAQIRGFNVSGLENPITLGLRMELATVTSKFIVSYSLIYDALFVLLQYNGTPACVFFDMETQMWSNRGCELVEVLNDNVYCQCNHLTSFAILMVCSFRRHNIILNEMSDVNLSNKIFV